MYLHTNLPWYHLFNCAKIYQTVNTCMETKSHAFFRAQVWVSVIRAFLPERIPSFASYFPCILWSGYLKPSACQALLELWAITQLIAPGLSKQWYRSSTVSLMGLLNACRAELEVPESCSVRTQRLDKNCFSLLLCKCSLKANGCVLPETDRSALEKHISWGIVGMDTVLPAGIAKYLLGD